MEENILESAPKPNPLTTITPFSKTLAAILFITLPFVGFYLGAQYQNLLGTASRPLAPSTTEVTQPISSLNNQSTPSATNETAGWKTYSSSKLGFSVKYPPDWQILYFEGKPLDTIESSNLKIENYRVEKGAGLSVQRELLSPGFDWNTIINSKIISQSHIDLDGQQAVEYIVENGVGEFGGVEGRWKAIVKNINNAQQILIRVYSAQDYDQNILNQILLTFKFLD